jgi:hypothetical protein
MNSNWPRWIYASITDHFAQGQSLPVFVEGQPRETWEDGELIEVRINGPHFIQGSASEWKAEVELNVLVQCPFNVSDLHRIHRLVGSIASLFGQIQIFKFGSGVLDDQSLLGCLVIKPNPITGRLITTNHYGQAENEKSLLQAEVEASFEVTF